MRIAALVSGGVDSSVALRLLQQQGHDVTAFYLKIWLEDELSYLGSCPWQEDLDYVHAVCKQAGVPLEVVSFQREYWDAVVSYMISEIKSGRTPNPDIMCNQRVKFGAFSQVLGAEFDKIATGHYAAVKQHHNDYHMYCSPDPVKDQTYFLSYMNQAQLARALFPLGNLSKNDVRILANDMNLPTKARKDSQGICFLGKIKFSEFIRFHMGDQPGLLQEYETRKTLGQHQGFWYYTIGQRQRIGLSGGPWYVVAKDPAANIVYVSRSYYDVDKKRRELIVQAVNWIPEPPKLPARLYVKLRHGPHRHQATVLSHDQSEYSIILDEHDQGIAPGQFAVFYDNDRCLGGGVIAELCPKRELGNAIILC